MTHTCWGPNDPQVDSISLVRILEQRFQVSMTYKKCTNIVCFLTKFLSGFPLRYLNYKFFLLGYFEVNIKTWSVLPFFAQLFWIIFLISEKYFALIVQHFCLIIKFLLIKNSCVLVLSQFYWNKDNLLGKEKGHCQKYLSK